MLPGIRKSKMQTKVVTHSISHRQERWAERHCSSELCLQTVPQTLHVLARSPRDFQSLLKMQQQQGLSGQTSWLQHLGQVGACVQLAGAVLGNPRAPTSTVLGVLPPQGQALVAAGSALAAERTESLEAEKMLSASRLIPLQRGMLQGCPQGRLGFCRGRQSECHPLWLISHPLTHTQGDKGFSVVAALTWVQGRFWKAAEEAIKEAANCC